MNAPDYLNIDPETLDLFRQTLELSLAVEELTPRNREIAIALLMGEEWPLFLLLEDSDEHTMGAHSMYMMLPTNNEKVLKIPNESRARHLEGLNIRMLDFIEKHKTPKPQNHND